MKKKKPTASDEILHFSDDEIFSAAFEAVFMVACAEHGEAAVRAAIKLMVDGVDYRKERHLTRSRRIACELVDIGQQVAYELFKLRTRARKRKISATIPPCSPPNKPA